jgi:hypothetical protein
MTEKEILSLKAGRELNIRVAEAVMGRRYTQDETFGDLEVDRQMVYGSLQPYSEDISAAWQVMEQMKGYNPRIAFDTHSQKWEATFSIREAGFTCPVVLADTAPEAICKAALLALLEVKHG